MVKSTEKEICGMPCAVDHENKLVYIKCSSSITAMGIPAIVKEHYPGYTGKLVSLEYLERLRVQLAN
jgi:hypothetical protein